jgi:hypothetical protein
MKPSSHIIAAVPLAAVVHLSTNSWESTALAVCASILIDVDHIADYLYYRRGWRGLGDFFETFRVCRIERTTILFHAWEWPILYALVLIWGPPPHWLWPIVLGQTYHLAMDTAANALRPSFYWLFRRALSGFELAPFLQPDRWRGISDAWSFAALRERWDW